VMPQIIKKDRTREPFDEHKLRGSFVKALEKRPVSQEAIEEAVARIDHRLRALGEREVESRLIGDLVMEELRHLDEVAYVRYASVYRHFQDIDAFREEVDKLKQRKKREPVAGQLSLLPGELPPPGPRRKN